MWPNVPQSHGTLLHNNSPSPKFSPFPIWLQPGLSLRQSLFLSPRTPLALFVQYKDTEVTLCNSKARSYPTTVLLLSVSWNVLVFHEKAQQSQGDNKSFRRDLRHMSVSDHTGDQRKHCPAEPGSIYLRANELL